MEKTKMTICDYRINSEHWVKVTHITNPHSFYVQPSTYKYYHDAMELDNSNLNMDIAEIKMGDTVVFKSVYKGKNLRGNIIFVNQNARVCDIFAMDHGFLANCVSLDTIYCLTDVGKELNIPPLAIHCQLADCEPIDGKIWKTEAIQAMKYYLGKKKTKMIIKGNLYGKYLVELKGSSPEDIATLMIITGYSSLPCAYNSVSKISVPNTEKHYYTYRDMNPEETIHVRVLIGKSMESFFVAEIKDYQSYLQDRDSFTEFYKMFSPLLIEELKEGRAVAVFTSQFRAERGLIKRVLKDEKAEVDLVDSGGTEIIPLDSMKKMTEYFHKRPPAAIYSCLEESQLLDYRFYKYLLPGYEFLITIKEAGNKFDKPFIVSLSELPNDL